MLAISRLRPIVAVFILAAITVVGFATDTAGIDRAGMDTATPPGEDFWTYANGTWVRTHPIPADRSSYGAGAILSEEVNKRTAELVEKALKSAAPGSEEQKVGVTYATFMDEDAIEAKGTAPLKPLLAGISAVSDRKALARVLGEGLRADVDPLNNTDVYTDNIFGFWASPAFDDPTRYVPFLVQGGLGMPDREYYLSDQEAMKKARVRYVAHIAAMLKLAGIEDSEDKARTIMALETKIARTHATRADSDDVQKGNNPWTRSDFATKAPGLDWDVYLAAAGLEKQNRFIVWQPSAVIGISALVASEPVDDWQAYLALRAIDHYADYLPKAFVAERFAFYGTALQGTPEQRARWKRAVAVTNNALGEAVGRLYVARYFPPEAKAELQMMVENLISAYRKRIDALDWMAPATKAEARRKLASLRIGIGYPDKWRDYSALEVVPGDALGNVRRAEEFEYRYRRASLGKPVDRDEWVMTPQTVNAVNLPILNALNFPAAHLQPPFFDPKAPAASNYGAIGATIGHEISHSFDDTGAQFDAKGFLRNWWSPADLRQFQAAGQALVAQFDGYKPFPDLGVNGQQTLGENIADLAGLAASYDAYRASLAGTQPASINGFSGDQQFFIAFAQNWRTYYRPEALRQRLINDGHAPARYRADAVRNLDAWYVAFPIKPADTLYVAPEKRVRIW